MLETLSNENVNVPDIKNATGMRKLTFLSFSVLTPQTRVAGVKTKALRFF